LYTTKNYSSDDAKNESLFNGVTLNICEAKIKCCLSPAAAAAAAIAMAVNETTHLRR